MIGVLTDNPNRAAAEVKNAVNKAGKGKAKMAEQGSVSYLYERKGRIVITKGEVNEEKVLDVCLEVGVEDFEFVEDEVDAEGGDCDVVYTEMADLSLIRDGLKDHAEVECKEAELCYKPMAPVEVGDEVRYDEERAAARAKRLQSIIPPTCTTNNPSRARFAHRRTLSLTWGLLTHLRNWKMWTRLNIT